MLFVTRARDETVIVAVLLGFGFGFVLERAGFGRSTKLAAQFYFHDMTVFKVMFSAIVVALLGMAVVAGTLASVAVDMMQDYRTGYLVEANPVHQTTVQFFDFGPEEGPLAAGYKVVTPGTSYSAAGGYGFTEPPTAADPRGTSRSGTAPRTRRSGRAGPPSALSPRRASPRRFRRDRCRRWRHRRRWRRWRI